MKTIKITNARVNNLKNVSIELPRNKFIIITGVSGSGKSSLAFDTIFKEGQRRYLDSISSYGKNFIASMELPDVDSITGLSPTIAIDQKTFINNPRSTVGTITEIHDFLRLLFAKTGIAHSPITGKIIQARQKNEIINEVLSYPLNTKLTILSPVIVHQKGEHKDLFNKFESLGYVRVRINGQYQDIENYRLNKSVYNNVDLVIDRITYRSESKERLKDSILQALTMSKGSLYIQKNEEEAIFFSEKYYCPDSKQSFPTPDASLFSFNSPKGACDVCHGLGRIKTVTPHSLLPDHDLRLKDLLFFPYIEKHQQLYSQVKILLSEFKLDFEIPISKYSSKAIDALLNGFDSGKKSSKDKFLGLIRYFQNLIESDLDEDNFFLQYIYTFITCDACNGQRLKPYSLSVLIENKNISELSQLSIDDLSAFLIKLKIKKEHTVISEKLLKEINSRLSFLLKIGLSYLTLDRTASTLSGGELQRIRLATQIGSALSGVIYILDEPSIGLHQRDNLKLINTLKSLRDLNNTVIVVEHDEETIRSADYIVDVGPKAGLHGGKIIAQGLLKDIIDNTESTTANFLSGRDKIEVPKTLRKIEKLIVLTGATENNLNQVDIEIPLQNLTCVTGVSGSGKSTLIHDIFIPALKNSIYRKYPKLNNFKKISGYDSIDDIFEIDQSPIGRTPKSIPATYCGILDSIRNLFAQTNDAKISGFTASHFSFNVAAGRCDTCEGSGYIKHEMIFLSEAYTICQSCRSQRYKKNVLDIKYKGLSISDVLNMTIEEGEQFFSNHRKIHHTLSTLLNVGLGYLKLGQPSPSLSGGEAQRLKLARELSKLKSGKCVYILDEPTTGLHFSDIKMLLTSLQKLVDQGHTVIVIEHNLDVIKCADYIIDLGPDGGKFGGKIVAKGRPKDVAKNKNSITGRYLAQLL